MRKLLLLLALFAPALPHAVRAQQAIKNPARPVAKTLYVKLPDGSGYFVRNRQLTNAQGTPDEAFRALSTMGWWSPVHHLSPEQLEHYRQKAAQKLGKPLPDFSAEFHFNLYDPARLEAARKLLMSLKPVQKVLVVPVPVNAGAPDLSTKQYYGFSVPTGIHADSARLVYGVDGTGIRICDIEYSYNSNHADLPVVTSVGAPAADPFGDTNHGTAVMGIIASKNDGAGTTGIAPGCALYFSPACTMPDTAYDLEAALTDALPALSAGDIILFEQQIYGPNYDTARTDQFGLVPVEWYEPYYNAIQLAYGNDLVVVEAAGNGQQNLDAPEYRMGNGGHYPFVAGNYSGAIIVGAGGVGSSLGGSEAARARLWYSNYGSRVDVQGNGEMIMTTGYGDRYNAEGANKYYTADFGGTSGASPIVVGGIALLQAAVKRSAGAPLPADRIATLLKSTGRPQANGTSSAASTPIGPLPDIYAAIGLALRGVGIESVMQEAQTLTVFPNPAADRLQITVGKAPAEVRIFNAAGALVRQLLTSPAARTVVADLSGEPSGTYFVQLAGSNQAVQKVLLTH